MPPGVYLMNHPDISGTSKTSLDAFTAVWEPKGWELVITAEDVVQYPAPLRYRDVWTSTARYEYGDVVDRNDIGYIAKLTNINADPATNPDKWEDIPGQTGAVYLRDPFVDVRSFSTPVGTADGDAFTAALASVPTGNNGVTLLTKDHQTVDATVLIQDRSGVVLTGTSPRGDSLTPSGLGDEALVQIINSYATGVEKVWLKGVTGGGRPFAIVESKVDASQFSGHPDAVQPTRPHFRDFWIGADTSDTAEHGILFNHVNVVGGSGGDQGNDQSIIADGTIYNVEKGIRFPHSQSVSHDITHMTIGNGVYGVSTQAMDDDIDAGGTGGQFRWNGGTMLQLTGACFHTPNVSQLCSIDGLLAEGCARLLLGGTSPGTPVSIANVAFSCDSLHADGRVIHWQGPGPISIGQSEFKAVRETSPGSGTYVYPKFYVTTSPYTAKVLVQGTAIVVDRDDAIDPGGPNERYRFPMEWGTLPVGSTFVGIGNQYNDRDGQPLPGGTFEMSMDGTVILELLPDGTLAGSAIPGADPSAVTTANTNQSVDGVKTFVKQTVFTLGLRVANDVFLKWRNAANSADISVMKLNSGNDFEFDGATSYQWQKPAGFNAGITLAGTNKTIQWEGGHYWTHRVSGTQWQFYSAATGAIPFALNEASASGQSSLSLLVNDGASTTLRRVNVGAADSGGSGQRLLTVAN